MVLSSSHMHCFYVKTVKDIALPDLESDEGFRDKAVSRGVAGSAMSETPALEGARRDQITCDVNIDSLAYWNNPQGKRDQEFRSPFAVEVRRPFDFSSVVQSVSY
jgi:hypothetical protein